MDFVSCESLDLDIFHLSTSKIPTQTLWNSFLDFFVRHLGRGMLSIGTSPRCLFIPCTTDDGPVNTLSNHKISVCVPNLFEWIVDICCQVSLVPSEPFKRDIKLTSNCGFPTIGTN